MTERKLKQLNALQRRRDELVDLQALAGKQLEWQDEPSQQPTTSSCRKFISVVLGNMPEVVSENTFHLAWLHIEGDIDKAVKQARKEFDEA